MTVDERIDAIAQSLHLLGSIVRDSQAESDRRFAHSERHSSEYHGLFKENEIRLAQLMETMNRLGRIIEIHDGTLEEHEERIDKLERDNPDQPR